MGGEFRVKFRVLGQEFFTEWYDSVEDAMHFVNTANYSYDVFPMQIEDKDGKIV